MSNNDPAIPSVIRACMQESIAYLDKRRCHVLSTELPDDLLARWRIPIPDDREHFETYMFLYQNGDNTFLRVPKQLFHYVVRKRYGIDPDKITDEDERLKYHRIFVDYQSLLYYIEFAREFDESPVAFDLFDFEQYKAVKKGINRWYRRKYGLLFGRLLK